jgi:hypothetical protein
MVVTVDNQVSPSVEVVFYRDQPVNVVPFAVIGCLVGALVGWLLLGWASRRLSGVRTGVAVGGCVVALLCVAPAIGWSVLDAVAAGILRPSMAPVPWWAGFTLPVVRPLSLVAGLVALATLGLALPRRRGVPGPALARDGDA